MRRKAQSTERDWVDTIRTQKREQSESAVQDETPSYYESVSSRPAIEWRIEKRGWFSWVIVAPIPSMLRRMPLGFEAELGPYHTLWGAERARQALPRFF